MAVAGRRWAVAALAAARCRSFGRAAAGCQCRRASATEPRGHRHGAAVRDAWAPAPSTGYLARGIGSDLMTDLSRLSGLRLMTRAATRRSARYVVSGSVQRDGGKRCASTCGSSTRAAASRSGRSASSGRSATCSRSRARSAAAWCEHLPGKISDAERRRLAQAPYRQRGGLRPVPARRRRCSWCAGPRKTAQARALYAGRSSSIRSSRAPTPGLAMTHAMDYRYQGVAAPPRR